MAQYRPVATGFWDDPDIEEMNSIEKLIYLFLFTNSSTTESGIYQISFKRIANKCNITKKNAETVMKNLESKFHKITYDQQSSTVFVHSFLKRNNRGNPEIIIKSILKDFKNNQSFVCWSKFIETYKHHKASKAIDVSFLNSTNSPSLANTWPSVGNTCIDTIDILNIDTIDTLNVDKAKSMPKKSNENENKNKERIKQINLSKTRIESGSKGGRPKKSKFYKKKPIGYDLDSKSKAKKTKSEYEIENEIEDENENRNKDKIKHRYGEYKHVLLTDNEYEKLKSDFGEMKLKQMIINLDEGIELKGYKYKNHNLALRKWEKKDRINKKTEPENNNPMFDDL